MVFFGSLADAEAHVQAEPLSVTFYDVEAEATIKTIKT